MAIASVGNVGTAGHATNASGTSWTVTGCTASVGDIIILVSASDNHHTTYGYYNEVASVEDSASNVWSIVNDGTNDAAYVYSPTGSVNDGAAVSIWKTRVTSALSSGTITITLNNSKNAKATSIWRYTVDSGNTLSAVSGKTVGYGENVDTAYLTALSISGLSSDEYLFIRGGAAERAFGSLSVSSGYTEFTPHAASSPPMASAGEFRILTGTSSTSRPFYNDKADIATIFIALREVPITPDSTGGMMLGMSF